MGEPVKKVDSVAKAYYDAIKALKLPVRNHNNLRKKIKELDSELGSDMAVRYLEFIRNNYEALYASDRYVAELNEAMDIYAKRVSIMRAAARLKAKSEVF